MDLNKAMLIGNIVADPEFKTLPSGTSVTKLRVATNRKWKDKNTGQNQEEAQFHTVIAWGKLGEICNQYMSKGMKVYIEGRITNRSWDDPQTGQKRYMTEIVADNAIMLGGGRGNNTGNNNFQQQGQPSTANTQPTNSSPTPPNPQDNVSIPSPEQIPTINIDDTEEIKVEDIPF